MRFIDIARNASSGTVRETLRQQIDEVSRELTMLEDLAGNESGGASSGAPDASIQAARASALQTQLNDKRLQLEYLLERHQALGAERPGETGPASSADSRTKTARTRERPGARLRLRRSTFAVALAPVAIVCIVTLTLPLGDAIVRRLPPIGATPRVENVRELVPAMTGPMSSPDEGFFSREITVSYAAGRVFLSGEPHPAAFAMDDDMEISVLRSDGSTATWTLALNEGCGVGDLYPAQELTHLFSPGLNLVTVALYDRCGSSRGSSGPVVLSNER